MSMSQQYQPSWLETLAALAQPFLSRNKRQNPQGDSHVE
jgi:hypothetical protein